jgi:phenylalanine-4-hydroxylase
MVKLLLANSNRERWIDKMYHFIVEVGILENEEMQKDFGRRGSSVT